MQTFATADLGALRTDARGVASLAIAPLPAAAAAAERGDYDTTRARDLRLALEALTPAGEFLYTELLDVDALDADFGGGSGAPVDTAASIRPDHVATTVGAAQSLRPGPG